jgi:ElaB/YqjD/DUF883 family membrane-anchored ribosome-binding protein
MTKASTTTSKHNHRTVIGDGIRSAGESFDEFTQSAGNRSDEMIHQGQEALINAQQEIYRYTDSALDYIKKYPLKSALIAGGIGLLLGKMFSK